MSDKVYQAIAHASSGFVESPAGCGKTEAIIRSVGSYCNGRQLILTHTHAGVNALKQRFRQHFVPADKYHIDTIAGWSWGWVRKYPTNALYPGTPEIAQWSDVYAAMSLLLQKDFVKLGITNSYTGIIVDEYQDCTFPMHQLIVQLNTLLPCRVLGDDLQGIFGFHNDPLVDWANVIGAFANDLGTLQTPYRWLKSNNEALGSWLLGSRSRFRQEQEPDYRGSPIDRQTVKYNDLCSHLIHLTHQKKGKICVIGPKDRALPAGIETALVKQNYHLLEPNELPKLLDLIRVLADGSPAEKSKAAVNFLSRAHGGISVDDKAFISKILNGKDQRPKRPDRRLLCKNHTTGATTQLVFALLQYTECLDGASCKLSESVSALKCILEEHSATGIDLKTLYADKIAKRKYQNRNNVYRCIGSTLLVKGLEFDHAIILRDSDWQQNWGSYKDLYVALTRGTKTTTLIELTQ